MAKIYLGLQSMTGLTEPLWVVARGLFRGWGSKPSKKDDGRYAAFHAAYHHRHVPSIAVQVSKNDWETILRALHERGVIMRGTGSDGQSVARFLKDPDVLVRSEKKVAASSDPPPEHGTKSVVTLTPVLRTPAVSRPASPPAPKPTPPKVVIEIGSQKIRRVPVLPKKPVRGSAERALLLLAELFREGWGIAPTAKRVPVIMRLCLLWSLVQGGKFYIQGDPRIFHENLPYGRRWIGYASVAACQRFLSRLGSETLKTDLGFQPASFWITGYDPAEERRLKHLLGVGRDGAKYLFRWDMDPHTIACDQLSIDRCLVPPASEGQEEDRTVSA